jgi:hypothetical protein
MVTNFCEMAKFRVVAKIQNQRRPHQSAHFAIHLFVGVFVVCSGNYAKPEGRQLRSLSPRYAYVGCQQQQLKQQYLRDYIGLNAGRTR